MTCQVRTRMPVWSSSELNVSSFTFGTAVVHPSNGLLPARNKPYVHARIQTQTSTCLSTSARQTPYQPRHHGDCVPYLSELLKQWCGICWSLASGGLFPPTPLCSLFPTFVRWSPFSFPHARWNGHKPRRRCEALRGLTRIGGSCYLRGF